jgi:hypothetical protein
LGPIHLPKPDYSDTSYFCSKLRICAEEDTAAVESNGNSLEGSRGEKCKMEGEI